MFLGAWERGYGWVLRRLEHMAKPREMSEAPGQGLNSVPSVFISSHTPGPQDRR